MYSMADKLYEEQLEKDDRLTNLQEVIKKSLLENKYWIGEHTSLTWGEVIESVLEEEGKIFELSHSLFVDDDNSRLWLLIEEKLDKLVEERSIQETEKEGKKRFMRHEII